MKKTPKNIPTYYNFPGTPIFRDTTALPFGLGGPTNNPVLPTVPARTIDTNINPTIEPFVVPSFSNFDKYAGKHYHYDAGTNEYRTTLGDRLNNAKDSIFRPNQPVLLGTEKGSYSFAAGGYAATENNVGEDDKVKGKKIKLSEAPGGFSREATDAEIAAWYAYSSKRNPDFTKHQPYPLQLFVGADWAPDASMGKVYPYGTGTLPGVTSGGSNIAGLPWGNPAANALGQPNNGNPKGNLGFPTQIPTQPSSVTAAPGNIKPPASETEWLQNPATGTWFQKETPVAPVNLQEYNLQSGTYAPLPTSNIRYADGGPLNDKTDHGKLLNSVYASALGDYYANGGMLKRTDGSYSPRGLWDNIRDNAGSGKEPTPEMLEQGEKINKEYRTGGQFPRPYSLPEDSFKQGGRNLHNSVYASSAAQYPAVYNFGGTLKNNLATRQQMYMPLDHITRTGGSILSMSNTPQLEGEGKDLVYAGGGDLPLNTGQKDQWGRSLNDQWYGFDPKTKKYTIAPYKIQELRNKAAGVSKYDPLYQKAIPSETTQKAAKNLPKIDKNITDKAVAQKTAERAVVIDSIMSDPLLSKEDKAERIMDRDRLNEETYRAYPVDNPDEIAAGKEYTTMDKIENIVRNPLVAATYAMQPGDFNMPMNYSEFERSPEYNDPLWNRNAVGQAANFARYFHPVGLAASAMDNAMYTSDDVNKALESGKAEDWKQAGYSGLNTALDLIGAKYIGASGRLLNTGERATLEAMNASNRLGLNPAVNNFLGKNLFPNVTSSVIKSADDLASARLFPELNPMSPKYNPIARKAYNTAVTAGKTKNMSEAVKTSPDLNPVKINTTENFLQNTNALGNELLGALRGKSNKKAVAEGNAWLENWIKHPTTQAKIETDFFPYIARNNQLNDVYDIGLEQAKNFIPQSKEYPLQNQLLDFVKGKKQVHSGNTGVSYIHGHDPIQRRYSNSMPEWMLKKENQRYKNSWISRQLGVSPTKRASTTIHEGTHDWTTDFLLNASGQKNNILQLMSPERQKLYEEWQQLRMAGKNTNEVMGPENAYNAYLADPTEMHARTMELRKHFNHTPETKTTYKDAEKMMEEINKMKPSKRPVDEEFFEVIEKDPSKLAYLLNRLWATAPIAVGGATLANPWQQEQKTDLTYGKGGELYTYSGRPDAQYQKTANGWAIKTPHNDEFTLIKDPTGKRTALLNEQATII